MAMMGPVMLMSAKNGGKGCNGMKMMVVVVVVATERSILKE